MAEPQVVVFEDQMHRRRKLQLHNVDGLLRVNLVTALTNYEAVSFSRVADGLILEKYRDSEFSAQSFRPGEVVSMEAVRRNAGTSRWFSPDVAPDGAIGTVRNAAIGTQKDMTSL